MIKQRHSFFIYFFLLTLLSCDQHKQSSSVKTLNFGAFTIEVPNLWRKSDAQGIDSYVGNIIIDSSDTIAFDLGHYSNPLTEREPVIYSRKDFLNQKRTDSTELILVDDYRSAKEIDQYKKQNLLWDTIDGREAKITYPRKPGNGITGVYIDSLWITKEGKNQFNLRGENLGIKNQRLLLTAIKTIRFRKPQ